MFKIRSLPQFTRNAKRFTEIVAILVKYGLAEWIRERDPDFIKGLFKTAGGKELAGLSTEVRVRMAMTELGAAFIKLGQILSTRGDIVGPRLAKELEKLQSDVPSDPPEQVRRMFEEELGCGVEEVFAEFDDTAVASGSIGQVHYAALRDGVQVVVKIQHQGIEDEIATDLDILAALAELAEKYEPDLRLYQPKANVAEFRRTLLRELDFLREERNCRQFARNFAHDATVRTPKPYPEFTTRRVFTMERLRGFNINDKERLARKGVDTLDLAKRGAQMYLDMIFVHGLFHADPHPGNIWILDDGAIGLLDCGMVGRLDEETREDVEGLLHAALDRDPARLTDFVLRVGSPPLVLDRDALRADLDDFIGEFVPESLKDFNLGGALTAVTDIIRRHRIILPTNISLLLKVLIMLEGTSRQLNRDFNLAELIKPYYAKAVKRRMSPERLLKKFERSYQDWDRLLVMLPRELADILQRVRDGKFDVNLEHRRLDRVINRLIYGVLASSLFVGSCMIISGKIPPLLGGVSLFGAAGCIYALVLGARLIRAIKKSGNL